LAKFLTEKKTLNNLRAALNLSLLLKDMRNPDKKQQDKLRILDDRSAVYTNFRTKYGGICTV